MISAESWWLNVVLLITAAVAGFLTGALLKPRRSRCYYQGYSEGYHNGSQDATDSALNIIWALGADYDDDDGDDGGGEPMPVKNDWYNSNIRAIGGLGEK